MSLISPAAGLRASAIMLSSTSYKLKLEKAGYTDCWSSLVINKVGYRKTQCLPVSVEFIDLPVVCITDPNS